MASLAGTDLVAAYSNGADVWVTSADLLNGETVNDLQPAGVATDADTLAMGQGGVALVRQTLAALWAYTAAKLPTATMRVVELTSDTVLDATSHNDAILVCSQPLTLSANFGNCGPGFACDVINLSPGAVAMGSGIITGGGAASLPAQASARLLAIGYSGGSFVFWPGAQSTSSGGDGSGSSASVTIEAPSSGIAGTAFTVSGNVAPSGDAVNVALGSSASLAPTTGWGAATVTASNWTASLTPAAAGTYFAWATDPTTAVSAASGAITVAAATGGGGSGGGTTVTWGLEPAGSYAIGETGIGANVVLDPGTAAAGVQFGWSTSTTTVPTAWMAGALVNTQGDGDTLWGAYLTAPATAGDWYCWAETVDAAASTVTGAITIA